MWGCRANGMLSHDQQPAGLTTDVRSLTCHLYPRYGMIYMMRAGFDPEAAVSLQETFVQLSKGQSNNWLDGMLASHPPSQERHSQ